MKQLLGNKTAYLVVLVIFTLAVAWNAAHGATIKASSPQFLSSGSASVRIVTGPPPVDEDLRIASGPTMPPPVDEDLRIASGPTMPPPVDEDLRIASGPTMPPPVDEDLRISSGPTMPPPVDEDLRVAA